MRRTSCFARLCWLCEAMFGAANHPTKRTAEQEGTQVLCSGLEAGVTSGSSQHCSDHLYSRIPRSLMPSKAAWQCFLQHTLTVHTLTGIWYIVDLSPSDLQSSRGCCAAAAFALSLDSEADG